MKQVSIWVALLVAFVAFAAGFWFANTLNRTQVTTPSPTSSTAGQTTAFSNPAEQDLTLTSDEIEAKISEAQQNAGNFAFQKELGLALYRYGAMKEDKAIIERSIPILDRAYKLNGEDLDVLIGIGNAFFDVGYYGKNNVSFEKAREFYSKALIKNPKDVDVRTDVGLTFFLEQPPRYSDAVAEFEKSLAIDKTHEKTLGFMIRSLDALGRDASSYRESLRVINPQNPALRPGSERSAQ